MVVDPIAGTYPIEALADDVIVQICPIPPKGSEDWTWQFRDITIKELNNIITQFHEGKDYKDYLLDFFGKTFE